MVVLLLAGLLANWNAPRRLQSFAAPVHADAAVNPAPEGSSILSTAIVAFVPAGRTLIALLAAFSISTSVTPLSFLGRARTATGALSRSRNVLATTPLGARRPS